VSSINLIWPFVNGLILGLVATAIWEVSMYFIPFLKNKYWDKPTRIFGYHVHHSVFGLLGIMVGILIVRWYVVGLGVGIIVIHTIGDGRLVFIEK